MSFGGHSGRQECRRHEFLESGARFPPDRELHVLLGKPERRNRRARARHGQRPPQRGAKEQVPPAGCAHLRHGLFHRRIRPVRHRHRRCDRHSPMAPQYHRNKLGDRFGSSRRRRRRLRVWEDRGRPRSQERVRPRCGDHDRRSSRLRVFPELRVSRHGPLCSRSRHRRRLPGFCRVDERVLEPARPRAARRDGLLHAGARTHRRSAGCPGPVVLRGQPGSQLEVAARPRRDPGGNGHLPASQDAGVAQIPSACPRSGRTRRTRGGRVLRGCSRCLRSLRRRGTAHGSPASS